MARGEQQHLLPRGDDVDVQLSVVDGRAVLSMTPKRHRPRPPRSRSCASLRSDVWTLLHYRSSLKHRSGLQRASYILEICVLVLITLNVVLAMYVSASPLGPARTWKVVETKLESDVILNRLMLQR
jgi:hypothetical protein